MSVFDNNINIDTAQIINNFRKAYPNYANLSDAEILTVMNTQFDNMKINEEEQISAFWDNNKDFNPLKIDKNSTNEPVKANEFNKKAEQRLKRISAELEEAESKNGFIGKAWSGFKNFTGIGDGSDKVREKLKQEKELLKQFSSDTKKRTEIFKELTGEVYNKENFNRFINGEIKLKSEIALESYKEGQDMACDITGDLVSGVGAVGLYSLAVATIPVTGGLSLAAATITGAGLAVTGGGIIKTLVKHADAKSGGREYDSKQRDIATGAFSGLLAPFTAGLGGAIGKTVATKLGAEVFKQGTKQAVNTGLNHLASASRIFNGGIKEGLKNAVLNPAGYSYGGTVGKQVLAYGAEMASDGMMGGAVDTAFRTAYDGGDADEVLLASLEGGIGGFFLAPILGGGMKLAGKSGHYIGKKLSGTNDLEEMIHVKEIDKFKKFEQSGKYKNLKLSGKNIQKINSILNSGKSGIFKKFKTASKRAVVEEGKPRFSPEEFQKFISKINNPYLKENKGLAQELATLLSDMTTSSAFLKTKFYKFEKDDITKILNLVTEKNHSVLKEMLKANEGKGLGDSTESFISVFERFSKTDEKLALKMINMVKDNGYISHNSFEIEKLLDFAEKYPEEFSLLSCDFHPAMAYKMTQETTENFEKLINRIQTGTKEEIELIQILYSPKNTGGSLNSDDILKVLNADLGLNKKQIITLCKQSDSSSFSTPDMEHVLDKMVKAKDKKFDFNKKSIYKKADEMTEKDIIQYLQKLGLKEDECITFSKNDIAEPIIRMMFLDDISENMIFGGIPKVQVIKQIMEFINTAADSRDLKQIAEIKSISRYLNKENYELYKANHDHFDIDAFARDLNENITNIECYNFCSALQKLTGKPVYEKDLLVTGIDMLSLIELKEPEITKAVSKLKELNLLKEDTNLITMLTKTKELLELNVTPEMKKFAEYLSKNKYIEEASVVDFLKAVQSENTEIMSTKINFAKELIANLNYTQSSIIYVLNNLSSKNTEVLSKQINVLKNIDKTEPDLIGPYSKFIKTDSIEEFNLLNNVITSLKKNYNSFSSLETVRRAIRQDGSKIKKDVVEFVMILLNKNVKENDLLSALDLIRTHCRDNSKEFMAMYLKGLDTDLSALKDFKLEDLITAEIVNINQFKIKHRLRLYEQLSAVDDKGKAVIKQLGIDFDKLTNKVVNSLGFKRPLTSVSEEQSQLLIRQIIANNNPKAEKILQTFNFEQFGKRGLPLKYTRSEFTKNIEALLKDLPENEAEVILKHFGLERGAAGFDGIWNNKTFSGKNVSEKAIETAKKIQKEIEKFTLNNEVIIQDKETKEVLDGLIKGFPEFVSITGKEQHGRHDYSVDIHTLKVLQSAMNDPLYKTLSDTDKTIIKYAILLHDFGKKGGVVDTGHASLSADYAWSILDRYTFPPGVKDRIIDIVDNHHWFEAFNTNSATAENVAVRCRRPEDLKIYEIFSKADFENVNPTFHLGDKTGGATNKAEFDSYMQSKFKAVEEAVNKIYQKANFIFDTQFIRRGKLFPTQELTLDGKKTSFKVLNLSELEEGADLSVYGFAPGVTRDNARFVVHMTEPRRSFLETVFRLTETPTYQSTWSSSLISLANNRTYWGKDFGVIFDVPQANYSEAFWGNTSSGGEKTLDAFQNFLFGSRKIRKEDIDGKIKTWDVRHYVKDNFIQEMEQKGYNLNETEYASLSQYLFNKKYTSQIRKDIQIGDKIIKARDLKDALEKSRDKLFYGDEHSELIPINPKAKGLIAKAEKLEDCPEDFLRFAQEHDLPVILMKPTEEKMSDKFNKNLTKAIAAKKVKN